MFLCGPQGSALPIPVLFREWGNVDSQCYTIQTLIPIGGDVISLFDAVPSTSLLSFASMSVEERQRAHHEWILVDMIDLLQSTGDKEVFLGLRSLIPQLLHRRSDLQQSGLFHQSHLVLPMQVSFSVSEWTHFYQQHARQVTHWIFKSLCRQPEFQRRFSLVSQSIRAQLQQALDRPVRLHLDRDGMARPAIAALERQLAVRFDEFGSRVLEALTRFVRDQLVSGGQIVLPVEFSAVLVRCALLVPSIASAVTGELTQLQQQLVAHNQSLTGIFPQITINPKEIEDDANKLLQSIYNEQLRVQDAVKLWAQFVASVQTSFAHAVFATDGRPPVLHANLLCSLQLLLQ